MGRKITSKQRAARRRNIKVAQKARSRRGSGKGAAKKMMKAKKAKAAIRKDQRIVDKRFGKGSFQKIKF